MLALPPPCFPQAPQRGEQVGGTHRESLSQVEPCTGMWWDTLGLRVAGGGWDKLGSAWTSAQGHARQQMEASHVIPAGVGVGREGHGRRTKTRIYSSRPFPGSPSLPPRTGLFLHFLCFSCLLGHPDADTHTKNELSGEAAGVPPAPRALLQPRGAQWGHRTGLGERPRGIRSPRASSSARAGAVGFGEGGPRGLGLLALPTLHSHPF